MRPRLRVVQDDEPTHVDPWWDTALARKCWVALGCAVFAVLAYLKADYSTRAMVPAMLVLGVALAVWLWVSWQSRVVHVVHHHHVEPRGVTAMDPDVIVNVIGQIGLGVVEAIDAFTPTAQAMLASLTVIAVVMYGLAMWAGGMSAFGAPLIRFCFLAGFTTWLLGNWAEIALGTLADARTAISWVIPGYQGPSQIFDAATSIIARMELSNSAYSILSNGIYASVFYALAELGILIGFTIVSLVAVLAEAQLLIAAAVAPFILPFACLGLTASVGLGALRFLLVSFVRTVGLGVLCSVIISAIEANLSVAGVNQVMTTLEVTQIFMLAALAAVFSVGCGSLFNGMIGHLGGGGSMGFSAVQHASNTMVGGAMAAGRMTASTAGAATKFAQTMSKAGTISRAVNNGQSPFGR